MPVRISILRQSRRMKADHLAAQSVTASRDFTVYRSDPVGYIRDVLKMTPTPDQERIARALLEPPYRVMAKSGHNIGKTALSAMLTNWWYDSRDPSAVITTAPTKRDVVDLLWTEVRLQRLRAGLSMDFVGPSAPEMRTGEEHYAKGFTANTGESFQGRHRPHMFFVFDEAEGVDGTFWKTAGTMFQPDGTNAFLTILNPTTTTSHRYIEERAISEEGRRKWNVFSISSLNHPNIIAELNGQPPPVPNAVSLSQVRDWLTDWFETIHAEERDEDRDIEFPPGSGKWYRPGPDGEPRVLGRNPSAGTYGVWSERLWQRAASPPVALLWDCVSDRPEIGIDVARFGDDRTEFHVRCGPCSLQHEDRGGWDTVQTSERAMALADEWAGWWNAQRPNGVAEITGKDIALKVDDTGVGGGVTDIVGANGYSAVPVNAGSAAPDSTRYQRVRDQLWFETVERARAGRLDLSRLPATRLAKLEAQALAPEKSPMPDRRWRVESKEETKKKVGRSPDGMDAVNLAYYEAGVKGGATWIETEPHRSWRDRARK